MRSKLRCNSIIIGIAILFFIAVPLYARQHDKESANTVYIETVITAVSSADLIISKERVSKSTSWFAKIFSPTSLEQRKENLITELCRETRADVLVDPQFTYKKRIFGGGRLTVSGYPARYKNFRAMTKNEIDTFIISSKYQTGKVVFINK